VGCIRDSFEQNKLGGFDPFLSPEISTNYADYSNGGGVNNCCAT
jgi:hypothetical protein